MTQDNTPQPFEKKTERLDIRLSHRKKQDFTQACEAQGDTPSNAVRRFVTTYIRRANRDEAAAVIRFSPWKKRLALAATFIIVGMIGTTIWGISSSQKSTALTAELFDIYDGNKNGLIELGEISPDDFHLHRVLNIDGQDGISRAEFVTHGTMVWSFVNPENFKIIETKEGIFKQRTIARYSVSHLPDGKSIDPNLPQFVKIDGEFVELDMENEDEYNRLLGAADTSTLEEFRNKSKKSDAEIERLKKFSTKSVKFDLRKPDKFDLTVFEQQVTHAPTTSYSGYQRGVTWVEGRKTPELVMGMGRENAVLTKQVKAAP